LLELGLEDEWLKAVTYVEVGPEGECVDKRVYVSNWERAIQQAAKDDDVIRKLQDDLSLSSEEENALAKRLNSPELYFNEDNLCRAYNQPGGTLMDFIRAALGRFKLKSREEELTENFQAWLVSKSLSPEQAQYLTFLKNRGVVHGKIEVGDLFQPPLSVLNAASLGVELFGEKGLKDIISDLNSSVFQKQGT
jgi:type I restriction enzyme R subunit